MSVSFRCKVRDILEESAWLKQSYQDYPCVRSLAVVSEEHLTSVDKPMFVRIPEVRERSQAGVSQIRGIYRNPGAPAD